jgi:hypothetical protein
MPAPLGINDTLAPDSRGCPSAAQVRLRLFAADACLEMVSIWKQIMNCGRCFVSQEWQCDTNGTFAAKILNRDGYERYSCFRNAASMLL